MKKGKLLIFSAPSGSGKTTLVNHLLNEIPDMAFSVSATSRPPRGNEVDGKEYYFISLDEFMQRVGNDEFLEWQEVYPGRCYGTLKAVVEKMREEGYHVAFDVDVVGGTNIKKYYGDEALSIFIQAPSIEVLRERLVKRQTDSMEEIEKRLSKAQWEMDFAKGKFDITIVNDDLETAKNDILEAVNRFLKQQKPKKKIGLYSGSFNPIHHGHVMLANYLVEFSDLDELWFLVSPQNPLKKKEDLMKDEDRLKMVELALEGDTRLKVSDIELSLPLPSYTINTLRTLSKQHPDNQFVYICGMDSLQGLPRWREYQAILDEYELLVFPRKGYDGGELINHPHVRVLETPVIEVSSTFIRNCMKEGKDVRHFMPEKAYQYLISSGAASSF